MRWLARLSAELACCAGLCRYFDVNQKRTKALQEALGGFKALSELIEQVGHLAHSRQRTAN